MDINVAIITGNQESMYAPEDRAAQECLGNVDLMNNVLLNLDIIELCRVARTSTVFQEAANSSTRWQQLAFIERSMTLQQVGLAVYWPCRRMDGSHCLMVDCMP